MTNPDVMRWAFSKSGDGETVLEVFDGAPPARPPEELETELAGLRATRLVVSINSAAGSVGGGVALYEALRGWRGEVTTYTKFAAGGAIAIVCAAELREDRYIDPAGVIFLETPRVARVEGVDSLAGRLRRDSAALCGVLNDRADGSVDWSVGMGITQFWQGKDAILPGLVGTVGTLEEARRHRKSTKPSPSRPGAKPTADVGPGPAAVDMAGAVREAFTPRP